MPQAAASDETSCRSCLKPLRIKREATAEYTSDAQRWWPRTRFELFGIKLNTTRLGSQEQARRTSRIHALGTSGYPTACLALHSLYQCEEHTQCECKSGERQQARAAICICTLRTTTASWNGIDFRQPPVRQPSTKHPSTSFAVQKKDGQRSLGTG